MLETLQQFTVFCDESYSASPHDLTLFVMTYNCNSQTTQYSKKNKIEKDNLKKIIYKKTMRRDIVAIHNITKKENKKETGKKPCKESYNAFPT